jgi:hypothetical protein
MNGVAVGSVKCSSVHFILLNNTFYRTFVSAKISLLWLIVK